MEIIDNALSLDGYKRIANTLLNRQFGWHFSGKISAKDADDGYYFAHEFYASYGPTSEHTELLFPIIDILQPRAIIRMKANLYPSLPTLSVHGFHVDQTYEHKGAIYYVNNNDGYTELEDGTKIESVANRLVLFDSSKPHRSTGCTDAPVRVTINFNYF